MAFEGRDPVRTKIIIDHHHHHLPPRIRSFDLFWHRRIAIVAWGVHHLFFHLIAVIDNNSIEQVNLIV
jgi:hypothetical protein